MKTPFLSPGDLITVTVARDESLQRDIFIAYHEKKKLFLTSVLGCFLAHNWSKNIRRAVMWIDGECASEVLREKGFRVNKDF